MPMLVEVAVTKNPMAQEGIAPGAHDQSAQNFHQANSRLRFWLDTLTQEGAQPSPQQMAGILSAMLQAGQWLRTDPFNAGARPSDYPLEVELAAYRRNVERLRAIMPSIHHQLLRERSRLEAERTRVKAAAAWVQSSRQTL